MWQIVLNGPGYLDTRHELLEGETLVGRADDNGVILGGDSVSRRHARLLCDEQGVSIEDLGSRNGTRLNGQLLGARARLSLGDVVEIGENRLEIRFGEERKKASTTVILREDLSDSSSVGRLQRARAVGLREALLQGGDLATLALLVRVSERLATSPCLEVFLDDVAELLIDLARGRTVVILLDEGQGMRPAAFRHKGVGSWEEVPISDAIVRECVRSGAALCVADALEDERFSESESVRLYGVHQVICAPLFLGEKVVGALYVTREADDAPPQPLLDAVTAVAHLAGSGIEQHRLRQRTLEQDRVRRVLERFLAAEVVERALLDFGESTEPRMEEKEVTLLFADISGFTLLTERLPPARVVELLDVFYRRMARIVFAHGGTVDKFMGDAVMALFGAPYDKPDDARRALQAALAMKAEFDELMKDWPDAPGCRLKVGLNTGRVLAGTVGGDERLEYTAVGDAVNVAARLVQEASPGQILVGAETLHRADAGFIATALGPRRLKGRSGPVEVWQLEAGPVGRVA